MELERPLVPLVTTLAVATPTQVFAFGGINPLAGNLSLASLQQSGFDLRSAGNFQLPFSICARGVVYVTVAGVGTIVISIGNGVVSSGDPHASTPALTLPAAGSYAVPFDLFCPQGSVFIGSAENPGVIANCSEAVSVLTGQCRNWII